MSSKNEKTEIIKLLGATAEAMGQPISEAALFLIASDVEAFSVDEIRSALVRVRRECQKLTPNALLDRLDDGFPGVEEAWASIPLDEYATVVWTQEAREAFGIAAPLLEMGDKVAARMAFREKYTRLVAEARADQARPLWCVSLGQDQQGREDALKAAVERNRLSADYARKLLPSLSYKPTHGGQKLLEQVGLTQEDIHARQEERKQEARKQAELNASMARGILDEVFSNG